MCQFAWMLNVLEQVLETRITPKHCTLCTVDACYPHDPLRSGTPTLQMGKLRLTVTELVSGGAGTKPRHLKGRSAHRLCACGSGAAPRVRAQSIGWVGEGESEPEGRSGTHGGSSTSICGKKALKALC